jgi:hypothetical protein
VKHTQDKPSLPSQLLSHHRDQLNRPHQHRAPWKEGVLCHRDDLGYHLFVSVSSDISRSELSEPSPRFDLEERTFLFMLSDDALDVIGAVLSESHGEALCAFFTLR